MAIETAKKIISVLTSILVVVLGAALIVCCSHLYFNGGDQPFSREAVSEYLSFLIIPAILTAVSVAAGLILSLIAKSKDADKLKKTNTELLSYYADRYDLSTLKGEASAGLKRLEDQRIIINSVGIILTVLCFFASVIYLVLFADFTTESINQSVINASRVVLPVSLFGLIIFSVRGYLADNSAGKSVEIIKDYLKSGGAITAITKTNAQTNEINVDIILRTVIGFVAVIFVFLGILNGGMGDVLSKAVKICTECIGLG